jgi:Mn-containing catalase
MTDDPGVKQMLRFLLAADSQAIQGSWAFRLAADQGASHPAAPAYGEAP